MKKNTMMRLAAVMLMCVLLTTSVVGGTFAKYVESAKSTDSARVAKWGVDVKVVVDGAFAEEYAAKEGADYASTIAKTVVTSPTDKDNLVAPGTNGYLLKEATISGTPEVAVNVKKEATLTLTGWEVDGAYYCPLVITIDGTELNGLTYSNVNEFIDAVKAKLNANDYVPANTALTTSHTVEWSWPFSTSEVNDKKDTDLGNASTDITIDFTYEITVTQVD